MSESPLEKRNKKEYAEKVQQKIEETHRWVAERTRPLDFPPPVRHTKDVVIKTKPTYK